MPVTEVFAGIAIRDRDAAVDFYERLLGALPTMLPNDDEAAWQLTGGGWLYVLRDADAARGIKPGPVETVVGSVRTTWITDPDGNRVQIGQPG